MRGLGTDHVISGSMRGLRKTPSDGANRHTDGHGDSMTELAQWGRFSENSVFQMFRLLVGWSRLSSVNWLQTS